MSDIKIIVRTPDQTRKAEVELSADNTGKDIIQTAVDNWQLPQDTDYKLVNTTTGKAIAPTAKLQESGVADGNILEVQPVLVAG